MLIDMPEGTTLERTAAVTKELSRYIANQDYVVNYQAYVGTASPMNFNGLVRHYDLRQGSNVADIQVNLTGKNERSPQSHAIAKAMRPGIQELAKKYNANVKVVEVPPGPPVMSTLVAEIYGPDREVQIDLARQAKDLFSQTSDVVDADWSVEDDQTEYQFHVLKEKAALLGLSTQQVLQSLQAALGGYEAGNLYQPGEQEQTGILLRLSEDQRSGINDLKRVTVMSPSGKPVTLGDVVEISQDVQEKSISRKNQKRVVYVTADVAGKLESQSMPLWKCLISERSDIAPGYQLNAKIHGTTVSGKRLQPNGDGMQIPYEVFRDLGAALLSCFGNLACSYCCSRILKMPFVMLIAYRFR